MKIPPRVREIIGKHVERLNLHIIAGPDCGGWHDLPDADRRKAAMIVERDELDKFLKSDKP